eukprot:scaffold122431_cov30-Tisochrysis_lutea.AAC.3
MGVEDEAATMGNKRKARSSHGDTHSTTSSPASSRMRRGHMAMAESDRATAVATRFASSALTRSRFNSSSKADSAAPIRVDSIGKESPASPVGCQLPGSGRFSLLSTTDSST